MQMVDFEYNGERLSDYGLTVCNFDNPEETVEIGSNISINKIKAPNAYNYISASYSYEDDSKPVIQICKSFCSTDDNYAISEEELRRYVRWLNRKGYYKFKPIYDDITFTDAFYMATFNIKLIKIDGGIVGLELTIDCDAPFGYVEPVTHVFTLNSNEDRFIMQDYSDEVGYLYCDATIKCLSSGDLKIYNTYDTENTVIVKNCIEGETIKLLGKQKIISTDKIQHERTLFNDFNYNYLRICNSYDNTDNQFTASIPCKIKMSYTPIRKVGLII